MTYKFLLGCAVGSSIITGCNGIKKTSAEKKTNVIFIVADDLGYGDLSCYGATKISTPNVDSLACEGLRFTDAHSVAATSTPSRYSIFTGQYNWRKKGTGIAAGNAGMIIRPEQETIADIFKQAGYVTGAIGKWHLGLGDKTGTQDWNGIIKPGPSDIGFDYSYLMAATGDRVPCVWIENQKVANYDPSAPLEVSYDKPFEGEPLGKDHPELLTNLKPSPNHGHDQAIVNGISRIGYMKGGGKALWKDENIADTIAAKSVEFIKNNKDKAFFLYVGTNDVHVPRFPHPRFVGKSGMGYRGDAILQFDWTVGEIRKALRKYGISDNTLIVLTSDNGPVVDDGYADKAFELLGDHKPWGELRGGKYSIFEAGTRVPFIVNWPSGVNPGVSDALVSHIDLFASMAEFVNVSYNDSIIAPDSRNQLPALLGNDLKGRDYVIENAMTFSVTDGEWKYIVPCKWSPYFELTRTESGNSTEEQLYNLKEDIGERKNLSSQYPDKISYFRNILKEEKVPDIN